MEMFFIIITIIVVLLSIFIGFIVALDRDINRNYRPIIKMLPMIIPILLSIFYYYARIEIINKTTNEIMSGEIIPIKITTIEGSDTTYYYKYK